MDVTVDGEVALVTGASRGIGRSVAEHLLGAGAAGVVVTGRNGDTLKTVAEETDPDRVQPVVGNVTDDDHAGEAVAAAVDTFGSCDILVNNAGTNPQAGSITDVEMGAIDKTWAVNQRAPLVVARAAWHGWMAEHGGAIVNVGSVGGLRPSPFIGAYNVSKAGLHHLTRQLAHELAPGVRVNAVAAAVVRTDFSRMLWESDPEAAAAAHPLDRLGEPADVARAVTFLAAPASGWITGIVLPVDGGITGAGTTGMMGD